MIKFNDNSERIITVGSSNEIDKGSYPAFALVDVIPERSTDYNGVATLGWALSVGVAPHRLFLHGLQTDNNDNDVEYISW